jgi:hypothetical protein
MAARGEIFSSVPHRRILDATFVPSACIRFDEMTADEISYANLAERMTHAHMSFPAFTAR